MSGVEEQAAVRQLLMGQQDLGHGDPEVLEGLFIGPHEATLPNGGCRLFQGEARWVALEAELLDARDNRPR